MLIKKYSRFFIVLLSMLSSFSVLANDTQKAKISTNQGDIIIELFSDKAPASVENFLSYAKDNFFNNTIFHRVIDGFMIQGGGYTTDYNKKDTRSSIKNEANNGLKNRKYTLSMARTSAPHSATSQFFINTANNDFLDHTATTMRGWGYAVFGRVIEGHDIVDAIGQAKTGSGGPFPRDVPVETVVINSISAIKAENDSKSD